MATPTPKVTYLFLSLSLSDRPQIEAPLLVGFGLRFNCYNLITKYVPEKPLKDAFYNCHKADYTIQSEIPQQDRNAGGAPKLWSNFCWSVNASLSCENQRSEAFVNCLKVCFLFCFSGFFKVPSQANMPDSSSILVLRLRHKTMRAAFH